MAGGWDRLTAVEFGCTLKFQGRAEGMNYKEQKTRRCGERLMIKRKKKELGGGYSSERVW
jgi:hypothetical protein